MLDCPSEHAQKSLLATFCQHVLLHGSVGRTRLRVWSWSEGFWPLGLRAIWFCGDSELQAPQPTRAAHKHSRSLPRLQAFCSFWRNRCGKIWAVEKSDTWRMDKNSSPHTRERQDVACARVQRPLQVRPIGRSGIAAVTRRPAMKWQQASQISCKCMCRFVALFEVGLKGTKGKRVPLF